MFVTRLNRGRAVRFAFAAILVCALFTTSASAARPGGGGGKNKAPIVDITSPADGTTTTAPSVSVQYSVVDEGVTTCNLANGATVDLQVGTNVITVTCTDSKGLSGTDTVTVNRTVPNVAPSVTITAPADGSTTTESAVQVSYAVSDDAGTPTCNIASGSFVPLEIGSNLIVVTCTDAQGLMGSDSVSVTRTLPPTSGDAVYVNSSNTTTGATTQLTFDADFAPSDDPFLVRVQLPPSIGLNFAAMGTDQDRCAANSVSPLTSPYTGAGPGRNFVRISCPPQSIVGSLTMNLASGGTIGGDVYLVNSSPFPQFGIWFDQGVETPFGRTAQWSTPDYPDDCDPETIEIGFCDTGIRLDIGGSLPQADTANLELVIGSNLERGGLSPHVFINASADDDACGSGNVAPSTFFTYPASGTVLDSNAVSGYAETAC